MPETLGTDRTSPVRIAPSILSADLLRLGEEIEDISTADFIHVGVMDGVWVPHLTFGPDVIMASRRASSLPVDCHLMVEDPAPIALQAAEAGARYVSFHIEACPLAHRLAQELRAKGAHPAIALNPATPVSALEEIAQYVDMVVVMGVEPGFSGQAFIPRTVGKVRELAELRDARALDFLIEVDGGVSLENAGALAEAGTDVFVAGSFVFGASDRAAAIASLRAAAEAGY